MGTQKPALLTDEEIVARYQAGESRTMLALRAKKTDAYVRDVLTRYGVAQRTPSEAQQVAALSMMTYASRQRAWRRRMYRGPAVETLASTEGNSING